MKKGRWGSRKVTLLPQEGAALSSSRDCFDAALRPWTRGDVEDVIKRARKATTGG